MPTPYTHSKSLIWNTHYLCGFISVGSFLWIHFSSYFLTQLWDNSEFLLQGSLGSVVSHLLVFAYNTPCISGDFYSHPQTLILGFPVSYAGCHLPSSALISFAFAMVCRWLVFILQRQRGKKKKEILPKELKVHIQDGDGSQKNWSKGESLSEIKSVCHELLV